MTESLAVQELGRIWEFTFDDMLRFHGGGSPGGVAIGFKVLQRAFQLLSPAAPPPRRSILVRTAFRGPGGRDGIEAVTRAVSDGRFTVDRRLVRTDRGRLLEDFVFEIGIEGSTVTLVLRPGFVTEEFIDLARTQDRTPAQDAHLDTLKSLLAQSVMGAPAEEVYETAG